MNFIRVKKLIIQNKKCVKTPLALAQTYKNVFAHFIVPVIFFLLYAASSFSSEGSASVAGHSLSSFIWRVITFAIFVSILYYFLKRPLIDLIDLRTKKIVNEMNSLKKAKNDLTEELEDAKDKFDSLYIEIDRINNKYKTQLEEEKKQLLYDARELILKLKTSSDNIIVLEKQKCRNKLLIETFDLVIKESEKTIKTLLDEDIHNRLNKKYINLVKQIEKQ